MTLQFQGQKKKEYFYNFFVDGLPSNVIMKAETTKHQLTRRRKTMKATQILFAVDGDDIENGNSFELPQPVEIDAITRDEIEPLLSQLRSDYVSDFEYSEEAKEQATRWVENMVWVFADEDCHWLGDMTWE